MGAFAIESGLIFPWSQRHGIVRTDVFAQVPPEPVVRMDEGSLGDESSYVRFDEMVNRSRSNGFSLSELGDGSIITRLDDMAPSPLATPVPVIT